MDIYDFWWVGYIVLLTYRQTQPTRLLWNLHDKREQKNAVIPPGQPDLLYLLPQINGHRDYGTPVVKDGVLACKEMYGSSKKMCSEEFFELLNLIKPDEQQQADVETSLELYIELQTLLETL